MLPTVKAPAAGTAKDSTSEGVPFETNTAVLAALRKMRSCAGVAPVMGVVSGAAVTVWPLVEATREARIAREATVNLFIVKIKSERTEIGRAHV